ncbi:MAG: stage V sporulation protein AD [Corallococcus sp.]|nr:stage V sporulation protein AD [Corallococcus sp.]MCM1359185.1 stage V sporulation protein AD [Corallococcus sp.]MCM1394575.1 stage V sporulation protein AD [Corallococcus sp.]
MEYYKKRTLTFNDCHVIEGYTVAGPKENDGRYRGLFDLALPDDMFGQQTFERAERKMFEHAIDGVIGKANMTNRDVDAILGGDLLNQCVSASFAARKQHSAFLGLYNACATFAESLILGATALNAGMENVICVAGSHFSTAERQYRYPLELGVLRSPVTQWTATGVGATVLSRDSEEKVPKITRATLGRVIDYGIMDVNNMGAAMAPSACDTLVTFFEDTMASVDDYDAIYTGDLGKLGTEILLDLTKQRGYDFERKLCDCGGSLFFEEQQTYQGGSGAACSALVFNSYLLGKLRRGDYKKILLAGTGALMSPTTSFQGDSIPAITHLVEVTA